MINFLSFHKSKNSGVAYDASLQRVIKFATKKNIDLIINEYKGYNWYLRNLKKKNYITQINKNLKKINKISYKEIKGSKCNYWNDISENFFYIKKVINFYKIKWPQKKFTGVHGDLTFSNIIFTKNNSIEFIDWENFHNHEVWGYDICYFLISTISLPLFKNNKKKFSNRELDLFGILWKDFFKKKKYIFSRNPVLFMKKRFKKIFRKRHYHDFYPNNLTKTLSGQISEITNSYL